MSLHTELTTLLGNVAGGQYYLQVLPQEYEIPCVVYRVLNKDPLQTLCGNDGKSIYEVVFECIAETFTEAETIEAEIKTILESDETLTKWEMAAPGEDFEPVTEDFMEPVYYGFFY